MKSYEELRHVSTFEDRFKYLSLAGIVGDRTFGSERYLNQRFYTSSRWRRVRDYVIVRDNGCDLAFPGREIYSTVFIHHINPLTPEDLKFNRPCLLDPENLISVSFKTHNAIHYGDESQLQQPFVERSPGDTKQW